MKVPSPQRMPSGNWRVRLRLGGEDLSISGTKEYCKEEALRLKSEYLLGERRAGSKQAREMTLKEAEENFIKRNRTVLSPSTVRGYETYKNSRFIGYQDTKLKSIDFQQMLNDELEFISPKTLRNAWGLVHAALDCVGFPIPKVKLPRMPISEQAFLQPEEILPFCEAVRGRSYEIAALLMLHGLRLSEVRGLTWDKVNLDKQIIAIRGAVVKGPDGFVTKQTNKNETSTRKMPILIPQLYDALKASKSDSGPVVDISPSCLLRDVKRACERAGVTVVSNHGLRHSFASLAYHLGISERQLMAWGGWADYTTMHKIYVRLAASDESKAAETVREFFKTSAKKTASLKDTGKS